MPIAVGPFSAVTRTSVSASAAPVISTAAAQTAAQIFFIMKIILSLSALFKPTGSPFRTANGRPYILRKQNPVAGARIARPSFLPTALIYRFGLSP